MDKIILHIMKNENGKTWNYNRKSNLLKLTIDSNAQIDLDDEFISLKIICIINSVPINNSTESLGKTTQTQHI